MRRGRGRGGGGGEERGRVLVFLVTAIGAGARRLSNEGRCLDSSYVLRYPSWRRQSIENMERKGNFCLNVKRKSIGHSKDREGCDDRFDI